MIFFSEMLLFSNYSPAEIASTIGCRLPTCITHKVRANDFKNPLTTTVYRVYFILKLNEKYMHEWMKIRNI